mmetsp:Transcript_1703/g.3733  ORF Transcript_1703/g.3733 Transcript_1703/m.3733 type:complete len:384 (+) Transcript_1703:114-1265(+)
MPLIRSRQPKSGGALKVLVTKGSHGDEEANKGNEKSFFERNKAQLIVILSVVVCCIVLAIKTDIINTKNVTSLSSGSGVDKNPNLNLKLIKLQLAPMGSIIYGAKSKGEDTAKLVKEAIQSGFRHIATGGFHNEYDEAGVGTGWKESGVPRNELYLQTLYLARSVNGYRTQNCNLEEDLCPPAPDLSLEHHVRLSVRSSLHNLQTHYIDSVLVHNFRAKLQPYEETLRVWRVLEDFVDQGVIRHLGIVSVHDKDYIAKLHSDARIKPAIIQNRFHSNRGYDINLRPMFKELGMANQLFWILTGSSGGRVRNNDVVKGIAKKRGVSPQILLYSFTMELGGSPLIGTKSITHMREDVDALITNKLEWEREDLVAMAGVINKNLIQ